MEFTSGFLGKIFEIFRRIRPENMPKEWTYKHTPTVKINLYVRIGRNSRFGNFEKLFKPDCVCFPFSAHRDQCC